MKIKEIFIFNFTYRNTRAAARRRRRPVPYQGDIPVGVRDGDEFLLLSPEDRDVVFKVHRGRTDNQGLFTPDPATYTADRHLTKC